MEVCVNKCTNQLNKKRKKTNEFRLKTRIKVAQSAGALEYTGYITLEE